MCFIMLFYCYMFIMMVVMRIVQTCKFKCGISVHGYQFKLCCKCITDARHDKNKHTFLN
jgi:hypothetical protein